MTSSRPPTPRVSSTRGPGALRRPAPPAAWSQGCSALLDVGVAVPSATRQRSRAARAHPADVADPRQQPGDARGLAGPHLGDVAEAGDDQPLRPAAPSARTAIGSPSRRDVTPVTGHGRRRTRTPVGDVEHDPGDHLAVALGRDRDGVLREAVEEVDGAVDRVDDPADPGGAGLVVALLAEEPVVGAGGADPAADQLLARPVDLGDHVGRRWTWWRRPSTRSPAPLAHQRGRLAGDVDGELEQLGRSTVVARSARRRPAPGGGRRWGFGQQPAGQQVPPGLQAADRGAPRVLARARRRPARPAGRGPWRRTAGRRRAWRPGRPAGRASRRWPGPRCRGRRRPPCGRRRSRSGPAPRPGAPCAASVLEVVVDVGLEPRHVRRPGPRAVDELVRVASAGLLADPLDDLGHALRCWAT